MTEPCKPRPGPAVEFAFTDPKTQEARLWRGDGWTAKVIKNEDDDGGAVAMIKDGEPEPALVGPWTMGRDKGGTWAGATEQLDKLRLVPVYVRSTGDVSDGLTALLKKGAAAWPNPSDVDAFQAVFEAVTRVSKSLTQAGAVLFSTHEQPTHSAAAMGTMSDAQPLLPASTLLEDQRIVQATVNMQEAARKATAIAHDETTTQVESSPVDTLFSTVCEVMQRLLTTPMKEAEVSNALEVSPTQVKVWLQRLVNEGVLEKQKKPIAHKVKESRLFD